MMTLKETVHINYTGSTDTHICIIKLLQRNTFTTAKKNVLTKFFILSGPTGGPGAGGPQGFPGNCTPGGSGPGGDSGFKGPQGPPGRLIKPFWTMNLQTY